jgi:hypothetical protein
MYRRAVSTSGNSLRIKPFDVSASRITLCFSPFGRLPRLRVIGGGESVGSHPSNAAPDLCTFSYPHLTRCRYTVTHYRHMVKVSRQGGTALGSVTVNIGYALAGAGSAILTFLIGWLGWHALTRLRERRREATARAAHRPRPSNLGAHFPIEDTGRPADPTRRL